MSPPMRCPSMMQVQSGFLPFTILAQPRSSSRPPEADFAQDLWMLCPNVGQTSSRLSGVPGVRVGASPTQAHGTAMPAEGERPSDGYSCASCPQVACAAVIRTGPRLRTPASAAIPAFQVSQIRWRRPDARHLSEDGSRGDCAVRTSQTRSRAGSARLAAVSSLRCGPRRR